MFDGAILEYPCARECCNPENTMKYICHKCGMCGRKFDGQVMTDDGGTTEETDEEQK